MRALTLVVGLLLAGCNPAEDTDSQTFGAIEGPEMWHELPVGEFIEGQPLTLGVSVTDRQGVAGAQVYYRTQGDLVWLSADLEEFDDDVWSTEIAPSSPVVEYYFVSVDDSEYRASSTLPVRGEEEPFTLGILVAGVPTPFVENFDLAVSRWSLYDLGWAEYSDGFQGSSWELSQANAHNGLWSAYHASAPAGEKISDWLVSPALDLSMLSTAQVTWYQTTTGEEGGAGDSPPNLSLWVSTSGRDPTEEDAAYQKLSDIELVSEEGWDRVRAIDLTAYAGEERLYLAWHYEGSGWNWFVDQIAVEELQADLELVSVNYQHVDPGGTSNISFELVNHGSETDGSLEVWLEVDPSSGSASSAYDAGVVANATTVEASLSVDVSEDYPDNYGFDYVLKAADSSQSWSWDLRLVVGDPSVGTVQIDNLAYGLVQIWLGSGDVNAPTVEIPVVQDLLDVGIWDYEVDLTPHAIYLPPDVGLSRWWLRIDAAEAGRLNQFNLDYDGVTYVGNDLGSWSVGAEDYFYLPLVPEPVIGSSSTDPSPIRPDSNVTWDLTIQNKGGETKGLTQATVTSADPEVTIVSGGPFELASDGWPQGALESLEVTFDVSVDQNDSTPIVFTVTVEDEDERFDLEVELPVPWAVLVATDVEVDDWLLGNGDGVLDVGETVSLEVELTNLGASNTGNGLDCVLSYNGSKASITFGQGTDYYSYIAAGSSRSENDFSITLDSGMVGDTLVLDMLCTDSSSLTYPSSVELVVGEPMWSWVDPQPDAAGDALNAYHFDLESVRYRVHNDELQLRFVSHQPYDPATLFLEAWMESPGASFDWYQIVAQSGVGTLRGYDTTFGFSTLGTLNVTDVSATTAQIDLDLSMLGLVVDTADIGFATGFCPSTFFCDHYPNGWGDPYSGMVTSSWFPLRW